ncbi:hypothetical protein BMW23_0925 [Bodo saltans virus]|uniref:Uncharacterized protein n=1 Tax=Bodo saltans virus TaxID=2024608 RepID=A0A2H4UVM7_9VIRU|nr:hypothetical protein QJ851_gp0907 [Bodo saltans virus]ATZ80970.1 hypothetical protein BMW23_0925 [Bodo saltans virus]
MPNNILNKLTITGDKRYIKFIVRDNFSFANIIPPPDDIVPDEHGNAYHWFYENWGTKFDAWDVVIEEIPIGIKLEFITAWTIPYVWLKIVIERFTDLQFKLYWVDVDNFPTGGYVNNNDEKDYEDVYDAEFIEMLIHHFPNEYTEYKKYSKWFDIEQNMNDNVAKILRNNKISIEFQIERKDDTVRRAILYYWKQDTKFGNNVKKYTKETNIFTSLEHNKKSKIIKLLKILFKELGIEMVNRENFMINKKYLALYKKKNKFKKK